MLNIRIYVYSCLKSCRLSIILINAGISITALIKYWGGAALTDKEIIMVYENYLRTKGIDDENVKYHLLVVRLISSEVLVYFNEQLNTIDSYCFEEFTDKISIIDGKLGGREGIPRMLDSLLEFTEFLKQARLIKGGKIAYYKRMFSDKAACFEKYDRMTGKKDDSKEYVRSLVNTRFCSRILGIVEDVNLYDFETMTILDKIINDVPMDKNEDNENVALLKGILDAAGFIQLRNSTVDITKKGRAFSRLNIDERYAILLNLLIHSSYWEHALLNCDSKISTDEFNSLMGAFSSVFSKNKELVIELGVIRNLSSENAAIEVSKDRFRIARAEALPHGGTIIDIAFSGMGLLNVTIGRKGELVYKPSSFGMNVFYAIYMENSYGIKSSMDSIGIMIKRKEYEMAEAEILNYLCTYGGSIILWNYLGQLYLIKKQYKSAYNVLKYAYENSSKRGKAAKSVLYHLVLCCRKLNLKEDIESYEGKLQSM